MEDSGVMEKLDSLWFFSNVLSFRSQALAAVPEERAAEILPSDGPKSEPSKPMSPILQNQKNQTENAEVLSQPQRCPKCGDFAAGTEASELLSPVKEEKSKRSKRSFKSCLNQRRRIFRESDVNFVSGYRIAEEAWRYQPLGSPHRVKMPPFSDGMAMKAHLKSWAYAVACTVR